MKREITEQFAEINTTSFYYVKKSARKMLRMVKKYIRYSKQKQTEAELLIHFCKELRDCHPSIRRSTTMVNLYDRQVALIHKALSTLHEDLQFDYQADLEALEL